MAKFTIEIETDNAAFTPEDFGLIAELSLCTRRALNKLEAGHKNGIIRDSNGNYVGDYKYE